MSHLIGSVEVGKLADLVLWRPAFFGAKPEMVIKGGVIAWSQMGDPNASIPTPQPVLMRPMFGSFAQAVGPISIAFVSQACIDAAGTKDYGLRKRIEPVRNCRNIGKRDMKLNDLRPGNHRRSGNLSGHRRRRSAGLRTRQRTAAGAAVFFILNGRRGRCANAASLVLPFVAHVLR